MRATQGRVAVPGESVEVSVERRPGLPYRGWLLIAFLVALAATAVSPHDRRDWVLEHLATVAILAFLVWYERRAGGRPLTDGSYTLLFVLASMHVLGAFYLYSRVPYVDCYESLTGAQWPWDTSRNHYDRLVHLCFGLFALPAIAELVRRHITPSRVWTVVIAIAFVAVFSKLYELAEWGIALWLAPEAAEAYNGQQGDMFDAQKDMALALVGSLVSGVFVAWRLRRRNG